MYSASCNQYTKKKKIIFGFSQRFVGVREGGGNV
jgi:hypothetical protein